MEAVVIFFGFLLLFIFIAPIFALVRASSLKEHVNSLEKKIELLSAELKGVKKQINQQETPTNQTQTKSSEQTETKPETTEQKQPEKTEPEKTEQEIKPVPIIRQDSEETIKTPDTTSNTSQDNEWKAAKRSNDEENAASASYSRQDMEQALGAKWSVWVGGLALALGAIFLVKYSIDKGLLGPGARMILAALFSMSMLGLGEYLRRKEIQFNQFGHANAHIPGILTAVGIIGAFATTYASYALYSFIGPVTAFILLAISSLTALFAAALHGPWLSVLGLVGSYVTPILVSTDSKNAQALFSYLAFIGYVGFALAFLRQSLWIAILATVGSVIWVLLWIVTSWSSPDVITLSFFILIMMSAGYIFLNRTAFSENTPHVDVSSLLEKQDWQVIAILMSLSALIFPIMRIDANSDISLAFLTLVILSLLAIAWLSHQLSSLSMGAAVLFCAVYMTWHIDVFFTLGTTPQPEELETLPKHLRPMAIPSLLHFLTVGGCFGALFMLSGFWLAVKRNGHAFWTIISAATPFALFFFAYWKATNFENSVPFGVAGFVITGLFILAAEWTYRLGNNENAHWSSGIYAAAAVSTLALSCTMLLQKGWLTVAFSLIALGLAWVSTQRPVPSLRYLAAASVALVVARLIYQPTILGDELGTTPIFNWLLYGYGIPAISFALSAYIFRKQKDDWVVQLLEAAALLFFVILIGQQIHHFMNDGNMYSGMSSLAELGLHTLTWLGLALCLQSINTNLKRTIIYYGSNILGVLGFISVVFGLLLSNNPLFTRESLGENTLFNPLILAYLLPAILCAIIYKKAQGTRHPIYAMTAGASALVLTFTYLSLQVRRVFQGPILDSAEATTSIAEWYTYSAVWLVYGIALLTVGIWKNAASLRYASCVVIMLTICKVFLFDLSHLTGLLRALSFIGLGLVLIAIGHFYQKYVFPNKPNETPQEELAQT